ncbi:ribonuclease H-like domain-containing protein [Rhizophagus irregularis DAOM 181602=DAOM 197198]|nr:ribonuclease H-like domain-containing protein [Rhizophagus irregularis DAOM 181602=DAOM 197198]
MVGIPFKVVKNPFVLDLFKNLNLAYISSFQITLSEIDKFQIYPLSPVCDESVDPLQCIPSKECFSISKNLITNKHNKLAGKIIRFCMCLKLMFRVH